MSANIAQVLLPYQREWLGDHDPVKVWEKSRRIGASWTEALAAVLIAGTAQKDGGQSTYYLAYNKDMTEQFIKDCAFWAGIFNVVAGEIEDGLRVLNDPDKDVLVFRIRFASGNEILTLPSEARSLRSKQGRVIVDEAAFVDDLQGILDAAMALTMWGGQVRLLSTHFGADNPFNELITGIHSGKFDYSLHRTTFDDALGQGLFQAICRKSGQAWTPEAESEFRRKTLARYGDGADEELFCIPSRSSGAYLTSALIESCMDGDIPVFRWQPPAENFVDWPEDEAEAHTRQWFEAELVPLLAALPPNMRHFLGEDFGRSGDLSILIPGTERLDLTLAVPFVLEMRNCPHRTQRQILFVLLDSLPRFSGAALDARGNGSYLAEAARQRYGADLIAEVMISENWYRETMPKLKSRFEDRTLFLPKDAHLLQDLRSLKVIRGVARIPDKRGRDSVGQRHGDAAVALGMLIHAVTVIDAGEPFTVVTGAPYSARNLFRGW